MLEGWHSAAACCCLGLLLVVTTLPRYTSMDQILPFNRSLSSFPDSDARGILSQAYNPRRLIRRILSSVCRMIFNNLLKVRSSVQCSIIPYRGVLTFDFKIGPIIACHIGV